MKEIRDNGRTWKFDRRHLEITELFEVESSMVASEYGGTLELLSSLERQLAVLDARYRAWRAEFRNSYANGREGTKMPSADVIKAATEATPDFLRWKSKIAAMEADVSFLLGWREALAIKSRMLAARRRSEDDGERVNRTISPHVGTGAHDRDREADLTLQASRRRYKQQRQNEDDDGAEDQ